MAAAREGAEARALQEVRGGGGESAGRGGGSRRGPHRETGADRLARRSLATRAAGTASLRPARADLDRGGAGGGVGPTQGRVGPGGLRESVAAAVLGRPDRAYGCDGCLSWLVGGWRRGRARLCRRHRH